MGRAGSGPQSGFRGAVSAPGRSNPGAAHAPLASRFGIPSRGGADSRPGSAQAAALAPESGQPRPHPIPRPEGDRGDRTPGPSRRACRDRSLERRGALGIPRTDPSGRLAAFASCRAWRRTPRGPVARGPLRSFPGGSRHTRAARALPPDRRLRTPPHSDRGTGLCSGPSRLHPSRFDRGAERPATAVDPGRGRLCCGLRTAERVGSSRPPRSGVPDRGRNRVRPASPGEAGTASRSGRHHRARLRARSALRGGCADVLCRQCRHPRGAGRKDAGRRGAGDRSPHSSRRRCSASDLGHRDCRNRAPGSRPLWPGGNRSACSRI